MDRDRTRLRAIVRRVLGDREAERAQVAHPTASRAGALALSPEAPSLMFVSVQVVGWKTTWSRVPASPGSRASTQPWAAFSSGSGKGRSWRSVAQRTESG